MGIGGESGDIPNLEVSYIYKLWVGSCILGPYIFIRTDLNRRVFSIGLLGIQKRQLDVKCQEATLYGRGTEGGED